MAISEELKKIYATAPVASYYIETLSLAHPIFPNGIRYLTNHSGSPDTELAGYVGNLEGGGQAAFEFVPFVVIPPSAEDEAALTLKVGLDNSSRVLMEELETMAQTPSQPIEVVYRIYINNSAALQNDPPLKLWVSSVIATQDSVSFSATTTNLRDLPFPRQLYNTDLFPGLYR